MAEFKAKQNPQTEKEMLDAIAEASFIAPIALQKQLDEVEPDENGQRQMQASLMAVSNKDGSKFFPAFIHAYDWLEDETLYVYVSQEKELAAFTEFFMNCFATK